MFGYKGAPGQSLERRLLKLVDLVPNLVKVPNTWQTSCMTNEYGESKFENCIDSCKQKVPPDQDQDCETEKTVCKIKESFGFERNN